MIGSLFWGTLGSERQRFGQELVTNALRWLFQMNLAVVERHSREGIMVNQLKQSQIDFHTGSVRSWLHLQVVKMSSHVTSIHFLQ